LLAYLLISAAGGFSNFYGVNSHLANLPAIMAFMALLVNYPHFVASYRLAYARGRGFLLKHWFQTLAVPLALLIFLAYSFVLACQPQSQNACQQLLGFGVNFMFFTVGWHYTKQAFGCMMVYAAYQQYPLTSFQREIIRWSLLSIWWYSFAHSGLSRQGEFWKLRYATWSVPDWLYQVAFYLFLALAIGVMVGVVGRNLKGGHRPPATMWVAYLAMMVWFAPCFRQPQAFVYVVPFFHSLQYLAFVYRVEDRRPLAGPHGAALVLSLILAGWLSFEAIPGNLDLECNSLETMGFSFCLVAFNLFINIHHYFLDNVLWRVRDDPEVRAALLS